jgi:hypothetical protein
MLAALSALMIRDCYSEIVTTYEPAGSYNPEDLTSTCKKNLNSMNLDLWM